MRLMCTVSVVNRQQVNLAVPQRKKQTQIKSTLALCKQPKTEEYCIILFSAQNKNGTKYPIKDNIKQVLTRFLNEGKTTIQFKLPEHDLLVQAEVIQLKSFLHLLRKILENKETDIKVSSLSVMPYTAYSNRVAPKKLVILKRSDYPLKGFPRTLEILQISDIKRCSLDRGILQLSRLKILNLENNLIENLPEEINKLPGLREIILKSNLMHKSSPRQWDWMGGNLVKTLESLDLSFNHLKCLPDQIVKLHSLAAFNACNNEMKLLPSGIGNLRNMRYFSAAHNQLINLPGSMKKWRLEQLELSFNHFAGDEADNAAVTFPKPLPVLSLRECAAKKVLHARLPYDSDGLPITLIRYLDTAKYCVCGKACFDHYIRHIHRMFVRTIAEYATASVDEVPVESYCCSIKCFSSVVLLRGRHPFVR